MDARDQEPEPDANAGLSVAQKLHFLWQDRPKLQALWDEREQRLDRAKWAQETRANVWRVVAGAAVIVALVGGLQGLGVLNAIRALLAP